MEYIRCIGTAVINGKAVEHKTINLKAWLEHRIESAPVLERERWSRYMAAIVRLALQEHGIASIYSIGSGYTAPKDIA